MTEALLGIDYGTSRVKVQLFDTNGTALGSTGVEVPVVRNTLGWVEQDLVLGWNRLCLAIRSILEKTGVHPEDIKAVSTTGTLNLSLYSKDGQLLRKAILYGDSRVPSQEAIEVILEELGADRVAAHFGFQTLDENKLTIILRTLQASKLLWLHSYHPEVFDQITTCIGTSWDFVNYRLTGNPTQLYNESSSTLESDIFDLFDIPQAWFAQPYRSGEIIGYINSDGATASGLSINTPVVMGAVDSLCAFLGAGLAHPGMALNAAGTTDVVAITVEGAPQTTIGYPVKHLIPGLWMVSLSPLRGGTLTWFRDEVLPSGATYADIDELAERTPAGSDGLMCLPYFSGEKGIVNDPSARGMLIGLDVCHQREHIARAILEGIAFGVREILDAYKTQGLNAEQVLLSGGGARSKIWNQIKADVLGQSVSVLQVLETGCLGSATLAAVAIGIYKDRKQASHAMAHIAETLDPNSLHQDIYQQAYQTYRQLYSASQEIFPALETVRNMSLGGIDGQ